MDKKEFKKRLENDPEFKKQVDELTKDIFKGDGLFALDKIANKMLKDFFGKRERSMAIKKRKTQIRFNTKNQLNKLKKIQAILQELNEYKPLTLRQVYYQMVGKGYIENKTSEYVMLSNILKWARIAGHIDWNDIEDRVRAFHNLTGWQDHNNFIDYELYNFLKGYRRDLLQSQEKYIELWIEKDALSSIFTKAAIDYGVPVVVCRGFSSISFLNDFRDRLLRQDKVPVMLYFGDFDPSGMEMLESMKITLSQELDIQGIEFKRIALLKDDIKKYRLPHNPKAIKETDTRTAKHIEKYGELAVELDALRPDVLVKKIQAAIENEIDIDLFKAEIRKQEKEIDKLNRLKSEITKSIKGR